MGTELDNAKHHQDIQEMHRRLVAAEAVEEFRTRLELCRLLL